MGDKPHALTIRCSRPGPQYGFTEFNGHSAAPAAERCLTTARFGLTATPCPWQYAAYASFAIGPGCHGVPRSGVPAASARLVPLGQGPRGSPLCGGGLPRSGHVPGPQTAVAQRRAGVRLLPGGRGVQADGPPGRTPTRVPGTLVSGDDLCLGESQLLF